MDLTITIKDENGEVLESTNIYQDGSDSEGAKEVILWIEDNYSTDPSTWANPEAPLQLSGEGNKFDWIISVGGGYGEFPFHGTQDEAEEMRAHKADWEGAVATKRLVIKSNINWEARDENTRDAKEESKGIPPEGHPKL